MNRARRESAANLGRTAGLRNRRPRPVFGHRVDKAIPSVGMALPARLQHVAEQEQSGELKTVLQVLVRPAVRATTVLTQERRQPQQAVAPGLAGLPRYRAAGLWRDVNQV